MKCSSAQWGTQAIILRSWGRNRPHSVPCDARWLSGQSRAKLCPSVQYPPQLLSLSEHVIHGTTVLGRRSLPFSVCVSNYFQLCCCEETKRHKSRQSRSVQEACLKEYLPAFQQGGFHDSSKLSPKQIQWHRKGSASDLKIDDSLLKDFFYHNVDIYIEITDPLQQFVAE